VGSVWASGCWPECVLSYGICLLRVGGQRTLTVLVPGERHGSGFLFGEEVGDGGSQGGVGGTAPRFVEVVCCVFLLSWGTSGFGVGRVCLIFFGLIVW